jgi:hypothetical protein
MSENIEAIKAHLEGRGVPAAGVTAMMANIGVETGYTYDYTTEQKGERTDPARGLFQFDPRGKGLTKPYAEYLQEEGREDSMESQLDFMVDSITGEYKAGLEYIGHGNAKKIREAFGDGDVVVATKIFSEKVLRPGKPHLDRRVAEAAKLEKLFGVR